MDTNKLNDILNKFWGQVLIFKYRLSLAKYKVYTIFRYSISRHHDN